MVFLKQCSHYLYDAFYRQKQIDLICFSSFIPIFPLGLDWIKVQFNRMNVRSKSVQRYKYY